jgi:hypothetical protein
MNKQITAIARPLSQREQKKIYGGQDNNFWVCVGFRPIFANKGACRKFCEDLMSECEKQVFE